jgi:hypothetical protein
MQTKHCKVCDCFFSRYAYRCVTCFSNERLHFRGECSVVGRGWSKRRRTTAGGYGRGWKSRRMSTWTDSVTFCDTMNAQITAPFKQATDSHNVYYFTNNIHYMRSRVLCEASVKMSSGLLRRGTTLLTFQRCLLPLSSGLLLCMFPKTYGFSEHRTPHSSELCWKPGVLGPSNFLFYSYGGIRLSVWNCAANGPLFPVS